MASASVQDSPPDTDLIFVLAGRESRKLYALKLFQQNRAARILLSVSRFEIRRFSKLGLPAHLDLLKLATDVPPPLRHFFVCFDSQSVHVQYVRPGRFGTLTEIESLGHWLQRHPEVLSLMIISSAAHLPRVRMCCKWLLRQDLKVKFFAAPDVPGDPGNGASSRDPVIETMKYFAYSVILFSRRILPIHNPQA